MSEVSQKFENIINSYISWLISVPKVYINVNLIVSKFNDILNSYMINYIETNDYDQFTSSLSWKIMREFTTFKGDKDIYSISDKFENKFVELTSDIIQDVRKELLDKISSSILQYLNSHMTNIIMLYLIYE